MFDISNNYKTKHISNTHSTLLVEFDTTLVRHVHREGNFAIEFLSHHAYNFERGVHVFEQPPTRLALVITC